jgi:hypothetical protein
MYVFSRAPARGWEPATNAGTGVVMVSFFKFRKPAIRRAGGRLAPARHVVSTAHGARTVLLDSRSGHYYGLDEVGSRIWSLAGAGFTATTISEKLAQEYDAPVAQLAQDVEAFLADLKRSRLLEER